jgi:hypothetical protein
MALVRGDSEVVAEQSEVPAGRSVVVWDARYRARYGIQWGRCQVLDISMRGAGLLLVENIEEALTDVVLEIRTMDGSYGIALTGEVRHSSTADGQHRIGIEFVDLSPFEQLGLRAVLARRCALKE